MVLADSTRARPRRTEQDRRAEPRRTSRGEGRARESPPRPQRPAQRHAARQPRAQAEPARPTTASRDGVEWQVPGLRPPAYRQGPEDEPGAHEADGANGGKGLTPRAALRPRFGMGQPRPRPARSGIGPGERSEERPPFTFIAPLGLVSPMTRTHVRLLGPCFKTGRVGHRPFARRER